VKLGRTAPVRALDHAGATRTNIPTAELESFARPEEKRPATVRYPRDPTLDPQLVWKGKDEQDGHDLDVPAVPIYIGETIDPLAPYECGSLDPDVESAPGQFRLDLSKGPRDRRRRSPPPPCPRHRDRGPVAPADRCARRSRCVAAGCARRLTDLAD